jgi:hypothetical protein
LEGLNIPLVAIEPQPSSGSGSPSDTSLPNLASITIIEEQGKKLKNYQRLRLEAKAIKAIETKRNASASVIIVDAEISILEKIVSLGVGADWNFSGGKRLGLGLLKRELSGKEGVCWLYSIPDNQVVQYNRQ